MQIPTVPWLFEILIGPAHVWIWVCAKICGVVVTREWRDDHDDLQE